MRVRTVSALTVLITSTVLIVPVLQAQRARIIRNPQAPALAGQGNLPSTTITPITNPVAPITSSPVQPVLPVGTTPRVSGAPRQAVPIDRGRGDYGRPGGDGGYDRRGRDRGPVVVVGGGYGGYAVPGYYDPYSYPYAAYPYAPYVYPGFLIPPPIPGQLPNTFPYPETTVELVPPPNPPVYEPASEYYGEPHMIISMPEPERTVRPPAIGTSRADVLAQYGQPWGSVRIQGKETLYLKGGLELVIEDGRVSQIR
jgi:hypothetical protein